MIALVAVFSTLTVLAILPWIVVALSACSDASSTPIECVIKKYDGTIISLGILVLVSGLALLTAILTNRSTDISQKSNRKIRAELQIASFRQKWIDALRNDLAEFQSICVVLSNTAKEHGGDELKLYRLAELSARIQLRMNPDDRDYSALMDTLRLQRDAIISGNKNGQSGMNRTSQEILKREWDRLKHDLRESI